MCTVFQSLSVVVPERARSLNTCKQRFKKNKFLLLSEFNFFFVGTGCIRISEQEKLEIILGDVSGSHTEGYGDDLSSGMLR
jgi:hypothetical protein